MSFVGSNIYNKPRAAAAALASRRPRTLRRRRRNGKFIVAVGAQRSQMHHVC